MLAGMIAQRLEKAALGITDDAVPPDQAIAGLTRGCPAAALEKAR